MLGSWLLLLTTAAGFAGVEFATNAAACHLSPWRLPSRGTASLADGGAVRLRLPAAP